MTQVKPIEKDVRIMEVQFSDEACYPICCSWSCVAFASIIGIVCLPCIPCCAQQYAKSQKAVLTDKHLKVNSGIITKEERTIPLDRIQDMKMVADPVSRCFGQKNLQVETAGSSGANGVPELILYGPVNPEEVRQAILDQRDALVYGHHHPAAAAHDGISGVKNTNSAPKSSDFSSSNEAILMELREIKSAVKNIEETALKLK